MELFICCRNCSSGMVNAVNPVTSRMKLNTIKWWVCVCVFVMSCRKLLCCWIIDCRYVLYWLFVTLFSWSVYWSRMWYEIVGLGVVGGFVVYAIVGLIL